MIVQLTPEAAEQLEALPLRVKQLVVLLLSQNDIPLSVEIKLLCDHSTLLIVIEPIAMTDPLNHYHIPLKKELDAPISGTNFSSIRTARRVMRVRR